ncbi:hypothetical protein SmJEL517_g03923 [Synchytrium microbalum]|uniref:Uncharacterized protein n=1 Tax=Synchytrium microbalum TaxID=1806994 RepID=A0A507C6I0_9FUNG|nr:uncharacterized protein SmJEL517_g03923 [Synchytrium microbalum]TPX33085.1 hypothetical protein SmJEL517_g03923 [Synchytrium microbalum]
MSLDSLDVSRLLDGGHALSEFDLASKSLSKSGANVNFSSTTDMRRPDNKLPVLRGHKSRRRGSNDSDSDSDANSNHDHDDDDHSYSTSTANMTKSEVALAKTGPLLVPHGFQTLKTLTNLREGITVGLHIPSATSMTRNEVFLMADSKSVHVWQGDKKTSTLSRSEERVRPGAADKKSGKDGSSVVKKNPMGGFVAWTCVTCWKPAVVVVATNNLELRILDSDLNEKFVAPTTFPVLSMEFIEPAGELVVSGAGGIASWTFKTVMEQGRVYHAFQETRLQVKDLAVDDWILRTRYRQRHAWLYAACGCNVLVYDFASGKRIDSIQNAHSGPITGLEFVEKLESIVTCGRDGTVNIWNAQKRLVYSLRDHVGPVTSMLLLNRNPMPMVLTCSQDGTLRIWDIDHGRCIGLVETTEQWQQVESIGADRISSVSRRGTHVWSLTRIHEHFLTTRARASHLRRIEATPSTAARLLVAGLDGAVRIFSPVNGSTICTILPPQNDTVVRDVVYDLVDNRIWVLFESGTIYVQSVATNPAKIIDVWSPQANRDTCTCIASIGAESAKIMKLFAGLNNGQLVTVDPVTGARDFLVQAHIASVTSLLRIQPNNRLLSCGKDGVIKLWQLQGYSTATQTTSIHAMASIPLSGMTPRQMCFDPSLSIMGVVMEDFALHTFHVASDKLSPLTRRHGKDDDHSKQVMSISNLTSIGLFLTTSMDGCVKVWDANTNSLLREIQLEDSLGAAAFANTKGDLVIGMSQEIVYIKNQDYLPLDLFKRVKNMNLVEDAVEEAPSFDSELSFWKDGGETNSRHEGQSGQQQSVEQEESSRGQDTEAKVNMDVLGSADHLNTIPDSPTRTLALEGDAVNPANRIRPPTSVEEEHNRLKEVKLQFRANLAALAHLASPSLGSRHEDSDLVKRARKNKGRRGRVRPNDQHKVYHGVEIDDTQYEEYTSPDGSDKDENEGDEDGTRERKTPSSARKSSSSASTKNKKDGYWDDAFFSDSDNEDSSDEESNRRKWAAADFFKDGFKAEREKEELKKKAEAKLRAERNFQLQQGLLSDISKDSETIQPGAQSNTQLPIPDVLRKPQVAKPKVDPKIVAAKREAILKHLGLKMPNTAPVLKSTTDLLHATSINMLNMSQSRQGSQIHKSVIEDTTSNNSLLGGEVYEPEKDVSQSNDVAQPNSLPPPKANKIVKQDFKASWTARRATIANIRLKRNEQDDGVEDEEAKIINWDDYESDDEDLPPVEDVLVPEATIPVVDTARARPSISRRPSILVVLEQPVAVRPTTPVLHRPSSPMPQLSKSAIQAPKDEPVPSTPPLPVKLETSSLANQKSQSLIQSNFIQEKQSSVMDKRSDQTSVSSRPSTRSTSTVQVQAPQITLNDSNTEHSPSIPSFPVPGSVLPLARIGSTGGGLGIAPISLVFSDADERRAEELAKKRIALQSILLMNIAVVASRNQGVLELKTAAVPSNVNALGNKKNKVDGSSEVNVDFGICDRVASRIDFPPLSITEKLSVPRLTSLVISVLKSSRTPPALKCDAMFVLFGIFTTFKGDLARPIDELVIPQLVASHDSDVTVRAYAGMMYGRYGYRHREVLGCLMTLLGDRDGLVRKGAALGLGRLGIATRDELILSLSDAGGLPTQRVKTQRPRDYLDELRIQQDEKLPKIRHQTSTMVNTWIHKVPKGYPEQTKKKLLKNEPI